MPRDPASLQRLTAMGIQAWQLRQSASEAEANDGAASAVAPADFDAHGAVRIRLSSGDGDWLLVQRQPWRGQQENLLADIRATLGPERCRFGQWVADSAAGEGPDELQARGVRRILSFGSPPREIDWADLLVAPSLDQLASEAEFRRKLWQLLAPVLGH
jgi:hypothetical protein